MLARGASTVVDKTDDTPNYGWTIGVSHPTLPDIRLARIHLGDRALGTSGTARQGFFHDGKRYGHIIDPRTGWPTAHTLSSIVIAKSAAQADALATAFFVMSVEDVERYCQQHSETGAVLVLPSENAAKPFIRTFNLADEDIEILNVSGR